MFSQFYGMNSKVAYARIDELLERLGLASVAKRQISGLSSGMRQKMNLVRGLMTDPRVLFLDEPTVALDVGAARDLREEVSRWMAEDPTRTVILTTHYMQEADDLCDRIAIVNRGQIVIEGTPQSLKLEVQRDVSSTSSWSRASRSSTASARSMASAPPASARRMGSTASACCWPTTRC